ncbi:MAG: ribonuclease III [Lachnospiraceae bacterium]|nr:ribonuclease III [Lachnospiraceae bacterium]MCR5025080.1 ribonuclease III [Lachnospiraceae bacterium]
MEESRLKTYSPLSLAFLGDAVFSLFMREHVMKAGNMSARKLHDRTVKLVSANAQEKAILQIIEEKMLSDEETDVYRRGENAKVDTHAKNASLITYHRATGFECLIGWLYLKEEQERIEELLTKAIEINE